MALWFTRHTSIFGGVLFVYKSLFGLKGEKGRQNCNVVPRTSKSRERIFKISNNAA